MKFLESIPEPRSELIREVSCKCESRLVETHKIRHLNCLVNCLVKHVLVDYEAMSIAAIVVIIFVVEVV